MNKFRITSIKFDTDGDKGLSTKLAKEWTGKIFEAEDEADADSRGADIISDASGWCIFELNFVKEVP